MRFRHRFQQCAAAALFAATFAVPLRADVKLPAVLGDHMVLQRGMKVPIWGWADAGESIAVTVGESKATTTAAADGKWAVKVDSLNASEKPIEVTVAGKNTIKLSDVLVGDVWVCSGQSNMEFQLGGGSFGFGGAHNAAVEIPQSDHPTLRMFVVKKKAALDPQPNCTGAWMVSTPQTAPKFSAVGYFFGKEIMEDQRVPVGLIGTYWGGTPAESWTSLEALKAEPSLATLADRTEKIKANLPALKTQYENETLPNWDKKHEAWLASVAAAKAAGKTPPKASTEPRKPAAPEDNPYTPSVLTNGMIAPIVPFAIKGAIWYQGEANAGAAKQYETLFPTMISDWRTRWGEGDFPFIWVQLANFMRQTPEPTQTTDGWPGLRDAQSKTQKLPHTAQAVIIDIGQGNDIHPKDKADVGHRLALAARHITYGEDIVYTGPTYDSMQVESGAIRVKFKNTGTGLTLAAAPSTQPGVEPASPATELKGFTIAGEDKQFVTATATIEPSANSGQAAASIIVSSPDVKQPKAVRYGWANNPVVNLYNKEHLPACPFRTDDWEMPTPKK
jgi:sialate O-acetylesterase